MKRCDVLPGVVIKENGDQHTPPATCERLQHNIREVMLAFHPVYGVLMLGPNDARDRVVEGNRVRYKSDDQRALVNSTLDSVRTAVATAAGRLVLVPVQCDASTPVPAARIDWLNGLLADYARKHSDVIFEQRALASCTSGKVQPTWTWAALQRLLTSH
jgi:hypothetical protein